MSSNYYDPFAEFASFSSPAPAPQQTPAAAPEPPKAADEPTEKKPVMNTTSANTNAYQQSPMTMNYQQPFMQQQQNPFGGAGGFSYDQQNNNSGMTSPYGMMNFQPIVPAVQQQQQSSPWSIQGPTEQQQQQQQPMGYGYPGQQQPPAPLPFSPSASMNGHVPVATPPVASPSPAPQGFQQPPQKMDNSSSMMVPSTLNSPFPFSNSEPVFSPNPAGSVGPSGVSSVASPAPIVAAPPAPMPFVQSPAPSIATQQVGAPVPAVVTQPTQQNMVHTAPSAIIQEDDDFFGDFSSSVQEKSPSRPPSVFEAQENDDVSYLSKSTGGTELVSGRSKLSPLDDPKFAPKPHAVHGLENAKALSQHAPPGASPLPDFDKVTHSGYVLSRISFRTILIKKWKQTFWVSYGNNQVLFFRSSADFEDWVSNPYLSQAQRDFLVKLKVDFVEDMHKQSVRGYQCTPQRLKNYNNQMLHQFKLERWMDYGPTIAAAFASPNEREAFNLRTILVETMKRSQPASVRESRNPAVTHYAAYNSRPATAGTGYMTAPDPVNMVNGGGMYGQSSPRHFSSSASTGRLEYGRNSGGASVYSENSHRSYGVMSAGPVERSRNHVSNYTSGYNAQAYVGSNGRY
eukprot:CAMPEP_0176481940 /NCGR_PEP_ID=MMETSP0200_2-20121128/3103_1 /TAXON_ID=947934 /ORGANISM="Chaetoceros sp., Strain GSL56" /LENGTH=625 /DNA_ID=CAMNT_0017878209 /DNA_START=728 /DNA_END=2605 /DNA_ORIENTATION=+